MVQDPQFIKQFIEELPADDREDLKEFFALIGVLCGASKYR